jgi:hypothetical protein
MAILMRSKATISGLTTDLSTLTTNIANEVTRATGVEGTLANLTTAVKTDLVAAINSEVLRATTVEGTLANLTTTDKTNLVVALNEEAARAKAVEGSVSALTTAVKTDLVAAINSEVSRAVAAEGVLQGNIDAVVADVAALGNAFNYVGTLTGGAAAGSAFDLASLASGTKDAGDYYKVAAAGYFKVGTAAAFYANLNDGLVWNLDGGVDKIDNTDSTVAGTTDFIAVSGSADTGFTVDVDAAFKTRMSTAEQGILDEAARAAGVAGTLASLTTAVKTDLVAAINSEVSRASGVEGTLANLVTTDKANLVGAINEVRNASLVIKSEMRTVTGSKIVLSAAPKDGAAGILNFMTVRLIDGGLAYDAPVTIDGTDATGKTFIISTDSTDQWNALSVAVQYLHALA